MLIVLALLISGAAYLSLRSLEDTAAPDEGLNPQKSYLRLVQEPLTLPLGAPDPPELTLAGYAYQSVATELPNVGPEDVQRVRQSVLKPSWASVRIMAPGRDNGDYYALFLKKSGKEWRAERSVLIEGQDHPKDVETLLTDMPVDLIEPLFPPKEPPEQKEKPKERAAQVVKLATGKDGWEAASIQTSGDYYRVRVENKTDKDLTTNVYLDKESGSLSVAGIGENLTSAELPGFPKDLSKQAVMAAPDHMRATPTKPVYDGNVDKDRVEPGLTRAQQTVEGSPGIAGFYAWDLKSGSGFGIRPNEAFFSASTIKVPVMVAVYRRIDEGKLSYSDAFETTQADWAAGAGWLRWDTPGAQTTVEDALWLMITQSDNVATNALVRKVGGPEYVNEVARSLGARNTVLFQKLSSERAAVPSLDNRTTPKDMVMMLKQISAHKAASDIACKEMIGLLEQNNLEYWMEAGVPQGIPVANKAGWLDATYNDLGIVEYEDHPYILATFTKYGPEKMIPGALPLQNISKDVWLAETGKTVKEYEKDQKQQHPEDDKQKSQKDKPEKPSKKP